MGLLTRQAGRRRRFLLGRRSHSVGFARRRNTRAVIYTDPWVITAGLEGQELEDAWTFLKFLVREDTARSYMQASNTPPTQGKLQEEWFNQFGCMEPDQVKAGLPGCVRPRSGVLQPPHGALG